MFSDLRGEVERRWEKESGGAKKVRRGSGEGLERMGRVRRDRGKEGEKQGRS